MIQVLESAIRLQIMRWGEPVSGRETSSDARVTPRENASAPYSHYKVGAAILWANRKISVGCNIENCVYNALHAEKCAIATGISLNGVSKIMKIAVRGGPETDTRPLPPERISEDDFQRLAAKVIFKDASFSCGQCLQDILEFSYGKPEELIMLECKDNGLVLRATLADVLPGNFSPADLGIHYDQIRGPGK